MHYDSSSAFARLFVVLSLLAPSSLAQDARSPRDLYVDAWFKETAESDFAGALKLYRDCADAAATTDRELAAKALLRVARIATARGDGEAAKIVMDRIGKEFADTAAAKEAAKSGNVENAGTSAAKDTDEAHKWLDEMLSNKDDKSERKATTILQSLGAAEVLRVYQARGGYLENVLRAAPSALSPPDWLGFATRRELPDEMRGVAIWRFKGTRPTAVPEELTHSLDDTIGLYTATNYYSLCVAIGTPQSFGALADSMRFLFAKFSYNQGDPQIYELPAIEGQGPERVIASYFEAAEARNQLQSALEQLNNSNLQIAALTGDTPGWRAVREWFPKFPTSVRKNIASVIGQKPATKLTEPAAAMLLADPEPRVRLRTISGLLASPDPVTRKRAAKALAGEPRPIDVSELESGFQNGLPALDEMLDELSGPLLEFAYQVLLERHSAPVDVLRRGLDRKDPELIRALFQPRWPRSSEITFGGSVNMDRQTAYYRLRDSQRIKSVASDTDQTLLARCVTAALSMNDEALAEAALRALSEDLDERFTKGVADLFVAASSPRVDRVVLSGSFAPVSVLSSDSKRALMRRPSRETRSAAINMFRDPALLAEIAETADPIDLELIRQVSEHLPDVQLAVLHHAAPDSITALKAFLSLVTRNETVLLYGLTHGGEDRLGDAAYWVVSRVMHRGPPQRAQRVVAEIDAFRALGVVEGLEIPDVLGMALQPTFEQAFEQERNGKPVESQPNTLKALAAAVEAHQAEWGIALREWQAAKVVDEMHGIIKQSQGFDAQGIGSTLATLGARDSARSLLDDSNPSIRAAGLACFAKLGDKATIALYAQSHRGSVEWIGAAIDVGAREEILASVAGGHLRRDEVLAQSAVFNDVDLLCQILLGGDRVSQNAQNLSQLVKTAVEYYAGKHDAESLVKIVTYYDSRDAVDALFSLGEVSRVLDGLPRWPSQAANAAMEELKRRTKIPAESVADFQYESVRREYVAKWKAALGL